MNDNPERPVGQASIAAEGAFDPAYFELLYAVEDRHFWFRARNWVVAALIRRVVSNLDCPYRVLEVGCGTGNTLRVVDKFCHRGAVVGTDVFMEGLRIARTRTARPLVQGGAMQLPFKGSFDVVCMFDVLEHFEDDERIVRAVRTVQTDAGTLVLTVPAYPALWSYFDELSRHWRRYTRGELTRKLQEAGYEITYASHFMTLSWPLTWCWRKLRQRRVGRMQADGLCMAAREFRVVPGVNGLLTIISALESLCIRARCRIPVGTSLAIIARKIPNKRE